MAGTKIGGLKAAQTNRQRHGEDFYQRIGSSGGQAKVPKGFAIMPYERVAALGTRGGSISRRTKSVKED